MEFHPLIMTLCNFVVAMSSCCERSGEKNIVQACEPTEAVRSIIDIPNKILSVCFYTMMIIIITFFFANWICELRIDDLNLL